MNAPQEPLVVIAAVSRKSRDNVQARFRDVGKKWRMRTSGTGMVNGREVVFTWMDTERWADWMKNMYGITKASDGPEDLDDVHVIIADHKVRALRSLFPAHMN